MPRGHGPFAVANRVGNPLVRMVLRSPLHGVVGGLVVAGDGGDTVPEAGVALPVEAFDPDDRLVHYLQEAIPVGFL